jgi:hypothetical protein
VFAADHEVHAIQLGEAVLEAWCRAQEVLEAGAAGRFAGDDALTQRGQWGVESNEEMIVGTNCGENVKQVARGLDHLGHEQQVAPRSAMGTRPGAPVLAALRKARKRIAPRDLVNSARNPSMMTALASVRVGLAASSIRTIGHAARQPIQGASATPEPLAAAGSRDGPIAFTRRYRCPGRRVRPEQPREHAPD